MSIGESSNSADKNIQIEGDSKNRSIIFVHGFGLNKKMWQWLPKKIRQEFRIITYDLCGHGKCQMPEEAPSLQLFSNQLLAVMKYCELKKAIIAGFSLGGMIVRKFAQQYPERVDSLIIMNSPHTRSKEQQRDIETRVEQARLFGPKSTVEAAMRRWFTDSFQIKRPEVIKNVKNWIVKNDPNVYYLIYKVLAQGVTEIVKPKPAICCPTLIISADQDFGNNPEMGKRIAQEIAQSEFKVLSGLKHMAIIENPERLGELIETFLNRNLSNESV